MEPIIVAPLCLHRLNELLTISRAIRTKIFIELLFMTCLIEADGGSE